MRVLVLGLGVMGTTYGYLLRQGRHDVEHWVRRSSAAAGVDRIEVDLLDGRGHTKGLQATGNYEITHAAPGSSYDLIIVSVGAVHLADVVKTLDDEKLSGPILLMSGIWETLGEVDAALDGREYILGYPVAGGSIDIKNCLLTAVVFDEVKLANDPAGAAQVNAAEAFKSVGIKAEHPADMLEWIWIHMAINAGVVTAAALGADIQHPSDAAAALMSDSRKLRTAIRLVRECLSIVEARGVDLKRFREEVAPFRIPTVIAAPLMKRMFRRNELARKIMLLHTNLPDLIYVCSSVYDEGQRLGVSTPEFSRAYEGSIGKLVSAA